MAPLMEPTKIERVGPEKDAVEVAMGDPDRAPAGRVVLHGLDGEVRGLDALDDGLAPLGAGRQGIGLDGLEGGGAGPDEGVGRVLRG